MSHNSNSPTVTSRRSMAHVPRCKCCKRRPITLNSGDPMTDTDFALCVTCAADLCPGSDVKRYNELLALYSRD